MSSFAGDSFTALTPLPTPFFASFLLFSFSYVAQPHSEVVEGSQGSEDPQDEKEEATAARTHPRPSSMGPPVGPNLVRFKDVLWKGKGFKSKAAEKEAI